MCERDENPSQVQQPAVESLWFAHTGRLWTLGVDSKKQA